MWTWEPDFFIHTFKLKIVFPICMYRDVFALREGCGHAHVWTLLNYALCMHLVDIVWPLVTQSCFWTVFFFFFFFLLLVSATRLKVCMKTLYAQKFGCFPTPVPLILSHTFLKWVSILVLVSSLLLNRVLREGCCCISDLYWVWVATRQTIWAWSPRSFVDPRCYRSIPPDK